MPIKKTVLLSVLVAAAGFAQKQPAAQQPAAVSWRSPSNTNSDAYAGAEICSACHAVQAQQFSKTAHAKSPTNASVGTACESCHGPGKAHAEAMADAGGDAVKTVGARKLIFGFHGKPAENSAACSRCHSSSQDQRLFSRSEHKMMGVSCDQCHSAHLVTTAAAIKPQLAQANFFRVPEIKEETRWLNQSLLKTGQPELCFSCHKSIQAQFALPSHHRVPEGAMKCTDCHDAHGTLNRSQLKKVNFESCVGCHTEKRGPFVYEHPAAKVEGCTSCHSPHGTVERNLLLRREGRFLCLQCHVNPQAENVPHSRLSFATRGECQRCHATIHGSNVNQFFLQ